MPPTFRADSFMFNEGEQVPDHVEAWPDKRYGDPSKYHISGIDGFEGDTYPLAGNIDDLSTAEMLRIARNRYLDHVRLSPRDSLQAPIADQVRIVYPDQD